MPKAVIPQPAATGNLLSGMAGVFAGAAAGEEFKEQKRQYNSTLDEQQRQYDQDMAFRIEQLRVMQREGKLTREQQERLAMLEQQGQNFRQGRDITSTETRQLRGFEQESAENARQRDFQSEENVRDRKLQDTVNKRNVAAENYRTKTMDDADRRGYALRTAEVFDQRKKLDQVGQVLAQYGKPGDPTWNEQTAFQQYLLNTSPPGSTDGTQGVPQLTPVQVQEKLNEFRTLTKNYDTELERNTSEVEKYTSAKARGEQVGKDPAQMKADFNFGLLPRHILDYSRDPDPLTGQPPIKFTLPNGDPSPLSEYQDEINMLDLMLLDTAANDILSLREQAQGTANAEALIKQFEIDLRRSLSGMDLDPVTARTLTDYYMSGAAAVLNGTPLSIEADMQGAAGGVE